MKLETFEFNNEGRVCLEDRPLARNWPVVYLINNDSEMYIGETQNAAIRFSQHQENPERRRLNSFHVLFDEEFNKSAILDIEQSLIQLCSADQKYHLQNLNSGQSYKHNYYQREIYLGKVDQIWELLKRKHLVNKDIQEVRNSDIFKYSPYTSLTQKQANISNEILSEAMECLCSNRQGVSIIQGGAGTGKTILLMNLIFRLIHATDFDMDTAKEDMDEDISDYTRSIRRIQEYLNIESGEKRKSLKIGYVCQMSSLRMTMKKVFKGISNGLKPSMVMNVPDVVNSEDTYDILLVDEAHRLFHRKGLTGYDAYRKNALKVGLDEKTATQLDMLRRKAKYLILVYDPNQSVRCSDITPEQFSLALEGMSVNSHELHTQMRCKGGEKYTKYIENIFSCTQKEYLDMEDYDFRLFENVNDMVTSIQNLDKIYGLCRNAAGYSWKWNTKEDCDKGYHYLAEHGLYDIEIDGYHYIWNIKDKEFILSKDSVYQIGCIHTLQGYDLNYVGVIFGREIDYDPLTDSIIIDRDLFFDRKTKDGVEDDILKGYILNAYKVMMSRGIRGCYVYCCNENLRKYLSRFIPKKRME
jgi:uncharacterized protein